jgi:hypothetical protein
MRRGLDIGVFSAALALLLWAACGEYVPIEPDIPTLDIYPTSADVEVSCSRSFDAGFESRPQVVRWYVDDVAGGDPWKGMITDNGEYVAPSNVPAAGSVTVRAQSLEDPTLEGTATVRITASPSNAFVAISPKTATVEAESIHYFSSTVSSCGSDSVIWSLDLVSGIATGGLGNITDRGVYEAPATSGETFDVLVRATSAACLDKSGIAKVRIPAQPRTFTVELENFVNKFNVPGSAAIEAEHCALASNGEAVVGMDRGGEFIEVPMYVRGAGNYLAYLGYAANVGARIWVRIEVDGCGAAGSAAGFTLDQGEGVT